MSAELSLDRTLWDANEVREYLRIGSVRTFDRARCRPGFPRPRYPAGRPVWIAGEIIRWKNDLERATVGREAPPLPAIEGLRKLDEECCVYFLCQGGRVLYVGQTTSLANRLRRHRQDGRQFDEVYFLPCPRESMAAIERRYIHELRPPLNNCGTIGDMRAPRAK